MCPYWIVISSHEDDRQASACLSYHNSIVLICISNSGQIHACQIHLDSELDSMVL